MQDKDIIAVAISEAERRGDTWVGPSMVIGKGIFSRAYTVLSNSRTLGGNIRVKVSKTTLRVVEYDLVPSR